MMSKRQSYAVILMALYTVIYPLQRATDGALNGTTRR